MAVFVIGLPNALRQRFEAVARRHNVDLGLAVIATDKRGRLVFVPFEGQACADLEAFSQGCNWDHLKVVVLPYVPIGAQLQESLEVLHENGAQLIAPAAGIDGWPVMGAPHVSGGAFNDELFDALCAALSWNPEIPPSEYFLKAARRLRDYVIFDNALDRCDEVHVSRHGFLKQSSTLLEQFCRKKGRLDQTLASFFQVHNIELAQSGGMQTTIRLIKNGRQLGQALTSNLHVKDGDGTTPQAAPRIYFQHLDKDEQFRLFLLYAGPHSDHVIDKDYEWVH